MKKNTALISASALIALMAATGAWANEYDGVAPDAWVKQTAISQQLPAPAPVASGAQVKADQNTQAVTP
jgi:nitrogen regulatory protein PII-like uncharacterized protein